MHQINDFPNEFSESKYTKRFRGALAKVKANSAQIIDSMIVNAINRRWIESKNDKHRFVNISRKMLTWQIFAK